MTISKDLVAASSTPIILSILAQGENYGYAIIQEVRRLSDERIHWSDGMLYPVLHRLENQELVRSRWITPESGRKRKYYRLTPKGARRLKSAQSQWRLVHATLARLWEEARCLI